MLPLKWMDMQNWRRFLLKKEVLVFLAAFGVRLLAFLFLLWWFRISGQMQDPTAIFPYPVLGGDSTDYAVLTQNLWQHGTFSSSLSMPLIPESFRLPGYPFFLYLFQFLPFPFIVATIVQMIMGAATATLVYLLGKKFLSEKAGLIGALLFAIEPTSILFSTTIMSDTIFVFALLLGIYLLFHKTKTLWGAIAVGFFAGVLFGYSVLVRVIAQYLAVFLIAVYLLINRKSLRPWHHTFLKLAVFAFAMILVMLPWALRNERVFDTYTLSSTPYINFTQYNLVYFYAYKNNVSKEEAKHVYADRIPYREDSFWFRSLINEEIFKQEMKEGLEGNVVPYAMFHLVKTLPFFLNDSLRDINRMIGFFPPPASVVNFTDLLLQKDVRGVIAYLKTPQPDLWMLLVGSAVWVLISLLSIGYALYAVITRQKNVWFVLFALGVIFYFGVLSSPVIQPRYRMPAAPFMLLLAAEAGILLYSLTKKRARR